MRHPLNEVAVVSAVLLVLGALAGCTSYTGSKANQVREWASIASVSSNDELIVQDVSAIKLSLRARRLKDVTSNCSGLVFDTGTAYGNLPAPDNTLTDELNVAYEDLAAAGSSCAWARRLGSHRITAALATIDAGLVSLDKAGRLLASDGAH